MSGSALPLSKRSRTIVLLLEVESWLTTVPVNWIMARTLASKTGNSPDLTWKSNQIEIEYTEIHLMFYLKKNPYRCQENKRSITNSRRNNTKFGCQRSTRLLLGTGCRPGSLFGCNFDKMWLVTLRSSVEGIPPDSRLLLQKINNISQIIHLKSIFEGNTIPFRWVPMAWHTSWPWPFQRCLDVRRRPEKPVGYLRRAC